MLRLRIPMNSAFKPSLSALAVLLSLGAAACTPAVDQRGNLPHPDLVAQVQAGKSTRDDVLAVLGTPSTTMTYGGESWHYISARTETKAFFEPEFKERKVLSIVFDKNGVVREITSKGLEDGREVESVERVTPTAGKDLTILEQLIGNVGRFSKDPAEK
ncbi:MAG TPA: outer membrane protein assembly factor BamE [Candidatus Omnitrophota bacterium]|nr:outer membrane protein assembly factor BamE [Candidatus Omnitrophota bacterium]